MLSSGEGCSRFNELTGETPFRFAKIIGISE